MESAALYTYVYHLTISLKSPCSFSPLSICLSPPRSSWTFFFLASYIASSPLEAFACHCIPVATGISFTLIIVRVGLGFSWAELTGSQLAVSVGGIGSVAAGRLGSQNDLMATYPLRMIVSVTQTVEKEVIDFALPREGNNADSDS